MLLAALAAAGPAAAQTDEQRASARALATEGAAAFNEGRYKDSADLFARAESRCAAAGVLVLAEAAGRGLHVAAGAKDGAGWFRGLVPVTPAQARARAALAEAFGTAAKPNAELAPTAVAFAAGEISVGHAGVVVRTVEAVQDIPEVDEVTRAEGQALLLDTALEVDPAQLGRAGLRLRHRLDPAEQVGGVLGLRVHRRQRAVAQQQRRDAAADGLTQAGVEQHLGVVVGVHVDEAGQDPLAVGADDVRAAGLIEGFSGHRGHDAVANAQRAALRAGAGAVEPQAVADDHVVGHAQDATKDSECLQSFHEDRVVP